DPQQPDAGPPLNVADLSFEQAVDVLRKSPASRIERILEDALNRKLGESRDQEDQQRKDRQQTIVGELGAAGIEVILPIGAPRPLCQLPPRQAPARPESRRGAVAVRRRRRRWS